MERQLAGFLAAVEVLLACDPTRAPTEPGATGVVQRTEDFHGQVTDGTAASTSPYEWRGIPGVTVEMAVWRPPTPIPSGDTLAYPAPSDANYRVVARAITDATGGSRSGFGCRATTASARFPRPSGFLPTTFPQGHQQLLAAQTHFRSASGKRTTQLRPAVTSREATA
jgi:hypothetical protein